MGASSLIPSATNEQYRTAISVADARDLSNQTAIVTGAATDIGKRVAIALAAAQARVVVNDIGDQRNVNKLVDEIRRRGGQAIAVCADVSQEKDLKRLFEQAVAEFETVDILVANMSLQKAARLTEMPLEQWDRVIAVNLTGLFLCVREAVRYFLKQGVRQGVSRAAGKIICTSNLQPVISWAGHVNDAASTGGVAMMMKSIAQEVAEYKIRVNSVTAGAIRSPIKRTSWQTPESLERLLEQVPGERLGQPQDIADTVVWLASDCSDYVYGATLYANGGMTL